MSRSNRQAAAGFTLLELVVVLSILAVVTAVATRTLSHMEDQRRFEAAQRGLDELDVAIVGSVDERAADGTRIASGFVADMGRLPRTVASGPQPELTLAELWINPGVAFDARAATLANGVSNDDQDLQVLVPGGWRGPYLRLPIGAANLLDGWGNGYSSPTETPSDPDIALTSGYARLRTAADAPITADGQEIGLIRHLGANGRFEPSDEAYDRDEAIAFLSDRVRASVKGSVEVLDDDSPAVADPSDTVTIKVFTPDAADASKIAVYKVSVPFNANPVNYEISAATVPAAAALTIGPRVVRAYFTESEPAGTTTFRKSAVKSIALRAGVNIQDLKIDR